MLADIDNPNGVLHPWNKIDAPEEVRDYYQLNPNASMRDVIACVRADEACHRATNHYLASSSQSIQIPTEFVTVVEVDNEKEKKKDDKKDSKDLLK